MTTGEDKRPSTRLTPRQQVLAKYPGARPYVAWPQDDIYIVAGLKTILGIGTTNEKAWADAARSIDG